MAHKKPYHYPYPKPYKLNLGCGRDIKEGWINIDCSNLKGVDIICDFENPIIDLPDGSVEMFFLSHILEHIHNTLGLMQRLWELAKPGAKAIIRVPYGSSDTAWEDQTHVRPYYVGSFAYFAQPLYWRADYGYKADWQTDKVKLMVKKEITKGVNPENLFKRVKHERNIVDEMVCEMHAVKPMRGVGLDLHVPYKVEINLVD